jgi:uncharacterized protein
VSLIISVKVVPQSGKHEIIVNAHGMITCFVKSAPEKGRANKELIKLLSKELGVVQRDIEIISGLTDRKKRIRMNTLHTLEEFFRRINVDVQESLC